MYMIFLWRKTDEKQQVFKERLHDWELCRGGGKSGGNAENPPFRFNDRANKATDINLIAARDRRAYLFYFICHGYPCCAFSACAHWLADLSSNWYTASNASRLLRYGSGISRWLSQ